LGCTAYDLWGAPDIFEPEDPMWGVYRFKAGFNAQVVRRIGAWDFVLQPTFYQIYTTFLPKILNVLRQRGKTRIQQDLS
jgi:lipid II:glycine glycyltransferase (peptidoglycan interpeptide bridge formation enzyme)